MDKNELYRRLDQEHTDALLTNYSGDYETWLEERIEELESTISGYEAVMKSKELLDVE